MLLDMWQIYLVSLLIILSSIIVFGLENETA